MKHLSIVLCFGLALAVHASARVVVPSLPEAVTPDAEVSTNIELKASNVVSRTAVYGRNLDNRSDYGLDKTAECRRTTNKLVARMYAAGAANKTGVAKRVAIIKQGSHPAPENLQYLYAFTNDVSYACLAAARRHSFLPLLHGTVERKRLARFSEQLISVVETPA